MEIDVHLTRDGVVVLGHDVRFAPDTTRRGGVWLSNASPPIGTMTLAEVRAFDVGTARPGSRARNAYPDRAQWDAVPPPTLAEIIEAMAARTDRPRALIVEAKTDPQDPDSATDAIALTDAVVALLGDGLPATIAPRVIAFDWRVLRRCRDVAPGLATGHLVIPAALQPRILRDADGRSPWADGHDPIDHGGSVARAVAVHGGTQLSVHHTEVTPALVTDAAAHGLTIAAWGLPGVGDAARIAALPLDSLTVSEPDWGQPAR